MTYTILIDQMFAKDNELSLVQVSTLAAFLTLPTWSKNIAIDGKVWYMYSDEKMSEDFPLLFGVPKRCYKNITELAEMGFVQLTKVGKDKYVRFTERCESWGREKVQKRTDSPKMDEKKSENGLNKSPKMDSNYIINLKTSNIINNSADGVFTQVESIKKHRGTTEDLCLFANSRYYQIDEFSSCFNAPEFTDVDVIYYYHAVADWSAQKGKKMRDWIATARNFMRSDMERNKLHKVAKDENLQLSADEMDYLKRMNELWQR